MYTYQHTPTINAQIGAETGAKNRLSCTLERYIRHQFSILVTITHTLTAMKWNRPPGPVLHRRLKTKKDIKIADAGLKLVRILILLAFILSKEWVRMELSSPSLPTIPDHHHHHLVISKYHTTSHTAFKTIQRDWCSSSATTIGTIAIRAVWYCYTRSKAPFKYCQVYWIHCWRVRSDFSWCWFRGWLVSFLPPSPPPTWIPANKPSNLTRYWKNYAFAWTKSLACGFAESNAPTDHQLPPACAP